MLERPLRTVIAIYLWAALAEDTLLFLLSWLAPGICFGCFTPPHRPVSKPPYCDAAAASGPRSPLPKPSLSCGGKKIQSGSR